MAATLSAEEEQVGPGVLFVFCFFLLFCFNAFYESCGNVPNRGPGAGGISAVRTARAPGPESAQRRELVRKAKRKYLCGFLGNRASALVAPRPVS